MKKKMYSFIFPIWILLIASPLVWLMILPTNFLIDTLVLIIVCNIFKIKNIITVYKRSILKMLIYGIIADLVGGSILLCAAKINPNGVFNNVTSNPFDSWITVVYISICIIITAVLTYLFNYKMTFKDLKINDDKKRKIALFIAIFTAPYLFFYPASKIESNISSNNAKKGIEIDNTYIGNTLVTRIFAESKNYTNSNFEYGDKINKVSSEIKSNDKSLVLTQISANFEDSDISAYMKWAKQCSIIVLVKDSGINTININLADENDESKIISNLVFERKDIESEYDVDLEKLQNDQEKLQEILDRIRQGD